jgi:hypothetical protein
MALNVLIDGIFPVEMSEVQKDIGIDFYSMDDNLPEKDINVYVLNSPDTQPTTEKAIMLLQHLAMRRGFWGNFDFANNNDYENIYNVKILDPTLGMYYDSYRYNFWDQIFSAKLTYRNYPTFSIDLRKDRRPIQVETIDGKKLDVERIMIPKTFTRTSTYVTEESPFNLPANFQVNIDHPGKVGRELFYTEPYGSHYFYAKSVLKRRIELLKQSPLSVDKIREFKIDDIDARILTEESLQRIFSALPSFAYETVGVMNSWFDSSKIGRVVRTMPNGLVFGTVGPILDICEEPNVQYVTQALLTLGRRTGGYIKKGKKLREVTEPLKETKIEDQSPSKEKDFPFEVYS